MVRRSWRRLVPAPSKAQVRRDKLPSIFFHGETYHGPPCTDHRVPLSYQGLRKLPQSTYTPNLAFSLVYWDRSTPAEKMKLSGPGCSLSIPPSLYGQFQWHLLLPSKFSSAIILSSISYCFGSGGFSGYRVFWTPHSSHNEGLLWACHFPPALNPSKTPFCSDKRHLNSFFVFRLYWDVIDI